MIDEVNLDARLAESGTLGPFVDNLGPIDLDTVGELMGVDASNSIDQSGGGETIDATRIAARFNVTRSRHPVGRPERSNSDDRNKKERDQMKRSGAAYPVGSARE